MERKRFLKIFESKTQYEELKNEIMGIPHTVLFDDSNEIFIQKTPFEKKYFTIESLDKGRFTINLPETYKFKFNNGEWNATSGTVMFNMEIGDTIQISYEADVIKQQIITTLGKFNVYGNIMSLLYGDDFEGQTELSENNYIFQNLFKNCTTLQSAENLILPATKLAFGCYNGMFEGCTSLTTAPQLPATTLKLGCYNCMFNGCTSLTTAPELPAIELTGGCYGGMFNGCTSLRTAPELPATTLNPNCYASMFQSCTSLERAPELSATTLAIACYISMFQGCTNLTKAPELPATTLALYCYDSMFYGCTNLTKAPELSATTLVEGCYQNMFNGCSNVNYIKMLSTDISADLCLENWVNGVAKRGTFVKNKDVEIQSGISGIPSGWTRKIYDGVNEVMDYSYEYFTIEALKDGEIHITNPNLTSLKYSINNEEWIEDSNNSVTINVNQNDKIQLSTIADSWYINDEITPFRDTTVDFNVYGNIMSLLYGDDFASQVDLTERNLVFACLFRFSEKLISAENLILPATTLATNCYNCMFSDCDNLITAPSILPAATLAEKCYYNMFYGCKSLTTAPKLPAMTLAEKCYYQMFHGCTSLETAPELPAIELASTCYAGMFQNCLSLNVEIELPATTLAADCYWAMFWNCTSLTTAPKLLATTLVNGCYRQMFGNCTSLTTAPELLATTLPISCYNSMFLNCSKLNYIKMLATNINATDCLYNWVNGVAPSGTFVKHPQLNAWIGGANGIPEGWTVENGYEYVDLGLPSGTLWATSPIMNIEGQPLYFQWGDIEGYTQEQIEIGEKTFALGYYKWFDTNSQEFTKYNTTDGKTSLDLEDDAAHVHMGGAWFIPSVAQVEELTANTIVTWTTQNGVNGNLFSSKINEQSLFIPALGGSSSDVIVQFNVSIYLWLDEIDINDESAAFSYGFSQGQTSTYPALKSQGRSIIGVKMRKD